MSDAFEPTQNPYHPYEDVERYRAFRDGWEAHHRQAPRAENPYPLARSGLALAWLDGWTAAARGEAGPIDRRRREAHRVRALDSALAEGETR